MSSDLEMLIKAKAVLGTAQAEISKFLGSVEDQTEKLGKTSEGTGAKIGAYFKGGFATAGAEATAFAGTVVAVGAAVLALGQRGAGIDDTRGAFAQLTSEVGGTAASIATLRKATDGVVTDFDLMDKTNKAFSLGLRLSQDQMSLTGESARVLADRVGVGVADAYGTLTMAMATGKDAQLKSIGLNIDAKKATDDYAKSLGIESSELNENQQIIAKRTAILAAMKAELDASGGAEVDFADRMDQMQVAVQNFNDNLSVAIATSPVLNEALGATADAVMGAFGDNQQAAIATMVSYINKFVIFIVDAASAAVSFGKYAGMAFYGVRSILFTVMGAVLDFSLMVADMQIKIVDAASKLPGVGSMFKSFGDQLRAQRAEVTGFADSFHQTADQALTDADQWGKGADNINAKLGTLRDKMVVLDAQGVSGAEIQANLAKAHKNTGDSASASSKFVEQLEKSIAKMNTAADLAAKNGALELWAAKNASALRALAIDAAAAGKSLSGNLLAAFLSGEVQKASEQAGKLATDIMKKQQDDFMKSLDVMNAKYSQSLEMRAGAAAEYSDLVAKRTLSDYEYQVYLIEEEEKEKIASFERLGQATTENLDLVKNVTAEKMKAATAVHTAEIAKWKAETNSWGNLTSKWMKGIPDLLKSAFTGGGGMAGALKGLTSGIGGDIGEKIFGGPNGLGQKVASGLLGKVGGQLAGKIGGMVGMMGGPIGSMLGGLAAKGIGKLFGSIFGGSKERKENAAATADVKAMAGEVTTLYGGMSSLKALAKATGMDITAAFGEQGKAGLEAFKGKVEDFKKKVAELSKTFGDWSEEAISAGVRLPASLTPYLAQLESMGVMTKEHADSLRALAENGTVDIDAMKAAADRYGISIAALGPAFQQGVANQNWQQIVDDMRLFEQGGADMNAVLSDMSNEISKLVQDSIAFGTSIPENMRPWVQKLMESGQLLDANGNKITDLDKLKFGDPMVAALDKIIERFDTLLRGLGLIPAALDAIPDNTDFTVTERRRYEQEGAPGGSPGDRPTDVPGAAAGGLFTSPAFRVVAEQEPEIVGSPSVIVQALSAAIKDSGMGGGNGGGSAVFNLSTPLATVDTIRQMFYEELGPVMLDWLNDNRSGSRTKMQRALGMETT